MLSKKRWLFIFVALMAAMSLVLAGCNTDVNENENLGEAPVEEPLEEEPVEEPLEEEPVAEPTATEELEEPVEEPAMAGGFGGPFVLASRLVDLEIETIDGEDIATLTDVLFGFDGQIQFLVFDTSEFLDEGSTIAVDWATLQATPATDTTTPPVLVYSGDAESLGEEPEVDVAVLDQQDLFVDATQLALDTEDDALLKASEFSGFDLTDYDVVNLEGEGLGEIEDLVLNLQRGIVAYGLTDVGGFLGLGENTVAIPWELVSYEPVEEHFVIPVTSDNLVDAPTVDLDAFESEGFEEDWYDEIDTFWNEQFVPAEEEEDLADDEDEVADVEAAIGGGFGGPWMMADRLIGWPIVDPEGDEVALVEEVLFTLDGEMQYALFDPTGFPGPDQVVAVPWSTFQFTPTFNVTRLPVLVYPHDEVLEEALEPGLAVLDEEALFLDPADLGLELVAENGQLLRASEFMRSTLGDYDVINLDGEDLGEIKGLVFNLEDGTASWAFVDFGGFLDLDENVVPIPWSLLDFDFDEEAFVLVTVAEDLDDAPTTDTELFAEEGFEEGWESEFDTFWEDFEATE